MQYEDGVELSENIVIIMTSDLSYENRVSDAFDEADEIKEGAVSTENYNQLRSLIAKYKESRDTKLGFNLVNICIEIIEVDGYLVRKEDEEIE